MKKSVITFAIILVCITIAGIYAQQKLHKRHMAQDYPISKAVVKNHHALNKWLSYSGSGNETFKVRATDTIKASGKVIAFVSVNNKEYTDMQGFCELEKGSNGGYRVTNCHYGGITEQHNWYRFESIHENSGNYLILFGENRNGNLNTFVTSSQQFERASDLKNNENRFINAPKSKYFHLIKKIDDNGSPITMDVISIDKNGNNDRFVKKP